MSYDSAQRAKKLLNCIGAIADSFLVETKLADPNSARASRNRIIKYSAIGVGAASVGFAIAALLLRPKRMTIALENALPESA
ncbi:MAG: hypothetical protein FWC20_01020 [Oscillospiraceae bacterium]|nr:hypothetical protein [Oscillospiraceae bacterium]MCL2277974.1 hypothetical protein [Oscillospiraceae bacterium]